MKVKDYKLEVTEKPLTVSVHVPREVVQDVFEKLSPRTIGMVFYLEVKAIGFKYKAPKRSRKTNTEVYDD